ncbi:hypothetical protein B566_EDAN010210 [Ephemera danica]|nr:hypothetical protein B566_EDAN010210 [Ephemera danica]
MAYSDVQVTFEIGHRSALRSKATVEGFTHDWEVFVRGVDGADISPFVDKVIFFLHETFPKPKRVIREPPYVVKESGYAGFTLNIDIYFKNKDEPKKLECNYDLGLQQTGPPITNITKHKVTFPNPSSELRRKLIRAGGIGVNGGDGFAPEKPACADSGSKSAASQNSKTSVSSQGKIKPSSGDVMKKYKVKEPKLEDTRQNNSFAALFGTPIKTSKVSPDAKKSTTSSSSKTLQQTAKPADKPISSDKPVSDGKTKHSTPKEVKKEKESGARDEKKEKREKSKEGEKKVPKASSPALKPPKEEVKRIDESSKDTKDVSDDIKIERKKKDKKNRDEKVKKDKHKDYEKAAEKPSDKSKEKESKKPPKVTEPVPESEKSKEKDKHKDGDKDRQKHKHKKKEKEKSKKSKDDGKDRDKVKKEKTDMKEKSKKVPEENNSAFKAPGPHSPSPPIVKFKEEKVSPIVPPSKEKTAKNPLSRLFEELSDQESSDSNISHNSADEDLLEFPHSKSKEIKQEEPVAKREKRDRELNSTAAGVTKVKQKEIESDKRKVLLDETVKDEKRNRKRKSSRESEEREPAIKSFKQEVSRPPQKVQMLAPPEPARSTSNELTDQYRSELEELQHKIMSLDDDEELQRLVNVVTETGQYEITTKTLDFDLCALDKSTVKRLQDFFRNL